MKDHLITIGIIIGGSAFFGFACLVYEMFPRVFMFALAGAAIVAIYLMILQVVRF